MSRSLFDKPACSVGEALGIYPDEVCDVIVYDGDFGFIFDCHEVEVRQGIGGSAVIVTYRRNGEVVREDVTLDVPL